MKILITGGAGYISSHTAIELLNENYEVVILDDFSNAEKEVMNRLEQITGKSIPAVELDVNDKEALRDVFKEHNFDAVIHCAGFKSVGESVANPLKYYRNNLNGTLMLMEVMNEYDVKKMVFSSSATVYGVDNTAPFTEDMPLSAINPYGTTKLFIEQFIRDQAKADSSWSVALLRYFNPIGAHKSGLIGENPTGTPNNLMPFLTQVAVGKRDKLSIYGDQFDTKDGTGVRDFIHVVDLAKGHQSALESVFNSTGVEAYNLGTGVGYSVLEIINTFESINNVTIPYDVVEPRPGDIGVGYAAVGKAEKELNWKALLNLEDMVRDSWKWQKNNPNGFA